MIKSGGMHWADPNPDLNPTPGWDPDRSPPPGGDVVKDATGPGKMADEMAQGQAL